MARNIGDDIFGKTTRKSTKKRRKKEEHKLSYSIATYLAYQYIDLEFRFDIAADLKLTMGQAVIVKDKLLHKRGYHDLTILEARGGYFGLFIELKKDKSEVYTKDGKLKRKVSKSTGECHNQTQFAHLEKMKSKGYKAVYGFGFEHTKKIIDDYMMLETTQEIFCMQSK